MTAQVTMLYNEFENYTFKNFSHISQESTSEPTWCVSADLVVALSERAVEVTPVVNHQCMVVSHDLDLSVGDDLMVRADDLTLDTWQERWEQRSTPRRYNYDNVMMA